MKTIQLLILCICFIFLYVSMHGAASGHEPATVVQADHKVTGRVTFVGTQHQLVSDVTIPGNIKIKVYSARFRIRISDATCTGDNLKGTRWISVVSGRMDGKFQHNTANFRNAYSTVLSAFLTKKNIQIDGVPSCDASQTQKVELWKAAIGIY